MMIVNDQNDKEKKEKATEQSKSIQNQSGEDKESPSLDDVEPIIKSSAPLITPEDPDED